MKKRYDRIAAIPDYALPYLVNGDDSGLTLEDKKIIHDWIEVYQTMAQDMQGIFEVQMQESETDSHFTWGPEFGLPCNAYNCHILILV